MSVRSRTAAADDQHALDAVDEPTVGEKIKAGAARNQADLEARIRRIVQDDQARRPGYDPTVRVTHVDPAKLAPAENAECADCSHEFRPGEGRWHDPSRHGLLVHTKGGCERARRRAAVRTATEPAPAPAVPPEEETPPMEATTVAPPAEDTERRSNPILDYLAEHGAAEGRVRRTGRSLPGGRGGPQIEWAIADGSPAPESLEVPERARVTAERVRNELAELIRPDGYCHGITLAEADADTLSLVLRLRRTIELLNGTGGGQ